MLLLRVEKWRIWHGLFVEASTIMLSLPCSGSHGLSVRASVREMKWLRGLIVMMIHFHSLLLEERCTRKSTGTHAALSTAGGCSECWVSWLDRCKCAPTWKYAWWLRLLLLTFSCRRNQAPLYAIWVVGIWVERVFLRGMECILLGGFVIAFLTE